MVALPWQPTFGLRRWLLPARCRADSDPSACIHAKLAPAIATAVVPQEFQEQFGDATSAPASRYQLLSDCLRRRVSAVADTELGLHFLQVTADRLLADTEQFGDVVGRPPQRR